MKRELINLIKQIPRIRKKKTFAHESENYDFLVLDQIKKLQIGPRELHHHIGCGTTTFFNKKINDTRSSSNNLNNTKPKSSFKRSWDEYL
tara:strand:+ start:567 stop:836 length:270 start_codon:yes stop_codon:yes gene_type:complete